MTIDVHRKENYLSVKRFCEIAVSTPIKKLLKSHSLKLIFALICVVPGLLHAQPYTRPDVLDPSIHFSKVVVDAYDLNYAYSGNLKKPGLLFLHGTPGGWGAFEIYLSNKQLQQDFFMVSVDRLGWGGSAIPAKLIDGDFDLQARSIKAVLAEYPEKKWTLIGHSLGASMAPKVALVSPDAVTSLLLLAGTLDPKLGKPRWYNRIANTWVASRLIGKTMRYSNREIMGLREELVIMNKEIKATKIDAKMTVMQGAKDRLVSPKNPAFVKAQWLDNFRTVEFIDIPNEGHFLPWNQTELVIQTIYQMAR